MTRRDPLRGGEAPASPGLPLEPRAASPFVARYRVYWEDTDASGIVYHANHLRFLERARTDWLRGLGFDQERLRREDGVGFVAADVALRWIAPARLDDLLAVSVAVQRAGAASLELAQTIVRVAVPDDAAAAAGTPIATARIRIGCVALGTFRPQRVPDGIMAAIGTPAAPIERQRRTTPPPR